MPLHGTWAVSYSAMAMPWKNEKRCCEIDDHRILIVDLGYSDIPSCVDDTEMMDWETLAETQQEQRAACIFITGASKSDIRRYFQRRDNDSITSKAITNLFPGWDCEHKFTAGSAIAVLWNPRYWNAECFHREILTKDLVQLSLIHISEPTRPY